MIETMKDYTLAMSDEFRKFSDKSSWKDDAKRCLTQTLRDGTKIEIVAADSRYQPIVTYMGDEQCGEILDSLAEAMAWAWNDYQARRLALYEESPDARTEMSF
jgi:hypothetical protein